MASKRCSIVFTRRTNALAGSVTLPLVPTLAAITVMFSLPVLMGLGARWSAHAAIDELQAENTALRVENVSYRQATEHFATQIAALHRTMDAIGADALPDPAGGDAMTRLPDAVHSRAMGGGTSETMPVPAAGFGSIDTTFGALRDVLRAIESRLDNVRSGLARQQALAAATPSIWPVAGWLSSGYGTRRDPFTGGTDFHPGLDISASQGQSVQATADGTVAAASFSGNYGNLVVLDHGFGITTRYGHLSRFGVSAGQQVKRGDIIGLVGSTGRSTSPHLHYEVLVGGRLTNPLKLLTSR